MTGQTDWFPRFGDIPGIDWQTPAGINRREILGHAAKPEASAWSGDRDYLSWPIVYAHDEGEFREGTTSQPPAGQFPMPDQSRTVEQQMHALAQALELPGHAGTYHQLLSDSAQYLYKIRKRQATAVREAERLALLDMQLLSLRQEVLDRRREILDDMPEDQMPVWVHSVRLLHRMYTENGALEAAERIAVAAIDQLGQRFDRELAEARERLEVLRSEDV